jgi:hypothetical protein
MKSDPKLDLAVLAAKKSLTPKREPDWDAIDAKLFARIDAAEATEEAGRVARLGPASRTRGWSLVAGGLAAAAAIAVYAGHKPGAAPIDGAATAAAPLTASALVRAGSERDPRDTLIAGAPASAGAILHVGEVIETHRASALLEREAPASGGGGAPGAPLVAWSVERDSRVSVAKATGALVVSLDRGAVEAQVTPVPSGEAFAVDVPGANGSVTRVAVHGTHLRVSRVEVGDHVKLVVDLSEGVVSIGAPPRAGSTYGALVTAPAHVELDTADPSSLVVSHLPEDVRTPVDLTRARAASTVGQVPASAVAQNGAQIGAQNGAPSTQSHPAVSPQIAPRPVPAAPRPPEADPNAEATVSAAVKACMAGRTQAPDGEVTVTVSSTLEIRLQDDGAVDLARFNPPLPPDVQLCAANAIYKTRFPRSGTLTIDLKF